MDETSKVIARLAGAVLFGFGLALAGFCVFAVERLLTIDRAFDAKPYYVVCGIALIGFFCVLVGYRLALNRPNRYQSILPPLGWYALTACFIAAGGALSIATLHMRINLPVAAGLAATFVIAAACLKAGRIVARRGMVDPLLPGEPVPQAAIPAPPSGWRIGAIGQTALFIHWSLPLGGLLVSSLSGFSMPETIYFCALYTMLLVIHELGHVAAARTLGLQVHSIEISGFGARCMVQVPQGVRQTLFVFSAGILAQLAVWLLTVGYLAAFGPPTTPFGKCVVTTFTWVNVILLVLSILPGRMRGGFANDGLVLWLVALHMWKGNPAPYPNAPTQSVLFPPETSLHRMDKFANAEFVTGIEILNDDLTPMEFVVGVLVQHLQIERESAIHMMLGIHGNGGLLIPLEGREHSEAVAAAMTSAARESGHPFICRAVDLGKAAPAAR